MLISDKMDPQRRGYVKAGQLTMSLVVHVALPLIPDRMPCTWKNTEKGDMDDSVGNSLYLDREPPQTRQLEPHRLLIGKLLA